jgi:ATP-dependent RNA helicase DDX23/PRP28
MREQRKQSTFLESLAHKRQMQAEEEGVHEADDGIGGVSALKERSAPADDESMGLKGKRWTDKKLEEMTDRDWRIMREDFDIRVRGGRAINPLRNWAECELHPSLRCAIEDAGYEHPTPIQRQAIPMGLAGRDLLGVAETGSGKTAAFLLPLLTYVLSQPPEVRSSTPDAGPLALVMAPTRELAQQIELECKKLCKIAGIRSVSVVGGASIEEQGHIIREGVDVVIGTPGRLIDAIEQSFLVLHQCRYVVLDEADRMIDMGFEPQVSAVLDAMGIGDPTYTRTTHMFTATMPPEIERLTKKYLREPAIVKIGDEDSGKNKRIAQEVIFLPAEGKKRHKLIEILNRCERPVIVFVNAKKQCDVVARDLENQKFRCGVLHSGKSQDIREESLADFKAGGFDILVATDVAGRGLDIPDVAQVINYDMPQEIDRYTHRIGRTGRAGKTGKATTFVTEDDAPVFPALQAYLESTGQSVPNELTRASARGDQTKYAKN